MFFKGEGVRSAFIPCVTFAVKHALFQNESQGWELSRVSRVQWSSIQHPTKCLFEKGLPSALCSPGSIKESIEISPTRISKHFAKILVLEKCLVDDIFFHFFTLFKCLLIIFQFKEIFATHLNVRTGYSLFLLLLNYDNIVQYSPSPLLSPLIRGCLETQRDIYNGGANHTLIGVQFISFSNTVDALYTIKKLCFDHDSALISLAELVRCLKCDWGYNMQEPFHDEISGTTRGQRLSDTYKAVRETAINLPKFGTSAGAENEDIQEITT